MEITSCIPDLSLDIVVYFENNKYFTQYFIKKKAKKFLSEKYFLKEFFQSELYKSKDYEKALLKNFYRMDDLECQEELKHMKYDEKYHFFDYYCGGIL